MLHTHAQSSARCPPKTPHIQKSYTQLHRSRSNTNNIQDHNSKSQTWSKHRLIYEKLQIFLACESFSADFSRDMTLSLRASSYNIRKRRKKNQIFTHTSKPTHIHHQAVEKLVEEEKMPKDYSLLWNTWAFGCDLIAFPCVIHVNHFDSSPDSGPSQRAQRLSLHDFDFQSMKIAKNSALFLSR